MWMINQLNEDLNDAFELHFPPMSSITRWLFRRLTNMITWGLSTRVRAFGGQTVVVERIVEYPLLFSWLPSKNARLLDIGCVSSRLPIQLASLGHEVHAVDIRPYRYSHRNLTFYQEDFLSWNSDLTFDAVFLISVFEHMGLGAYGDITSQDTEHQVLQKIRRLLKPGGQLVVSVPFGKRDQNWKYRTYDLQQLEALFAGFLWRQTSYFLRRDADWVPALLDDLRDVPSPLGTVNGVVVLDLVRPDSGDQWPKAEA